jgi:hypothetical protein
MYEIIIEEQRETKKRVLTSNEIPNLVCNPR